MTGLRPWRAGVLKLWQCPWASFAVSVGVYAAAIVLVGHYRAPTLWENGAIADNILSGKGFVLSFSRPDEPTSWQAPGYPYLLAWTWRWMGKNTRAFFVFSLLQAVALASVVFPLGRLVTRWYGNAAGGVARWMVPVFPLYVWYATRLHHTAVVMALHPWLLWVWVMALDPQASWRWSTGAGLLTGVAGLFQPLLLAGYGVLVLVRWLASLARRQWTVVRRGVWAGILTGLVLTPWTLRNYAVHGRWLLVKNSFGKEFWMGNNPHATGTGYAPGGQREITAAYPPACFSLRGQVSEMELMEALQDEALAFVRAHPARFASLTLRRMLWYWTWPPADRVRSTKGGEALKFRRIFIGYWTLLAAAAIGGWLWRGIPPEYRVALTCLVVIYTLVYGVTHVGQARFRGEIEFLFFPAAAALIAELARRAWPGIREATPS